LGRGYRGYSKLFDNSFSVVSTTEPFCEEGHNATPEDWCGDRTQLLSVQGPVPGGQQYPLSVSDPANVDVRCAAHTMAGSSDSSPFLLGGATGRGTRYCAAEGKGADHMGRQKNLHVIMSCIEELLTQDGLESEQKDALATALKAVKHFRRNATPSEADVYRIVRIVAEEISKNFIR